MVIGVPKETHAADRRVDRPGARGRAPLDERQVLPRDLPRLERGLQRPVGLLRPGHDEQAGRVAVQTVNKAGPLAKFDRESQKQPINVLMGLAAPLHRKSGWLIQHIDNNADVGVPFLSNIPLLGNAVKKVEKKTSVVETVILMTAKIITPRSNYHPQDKKLYDTFTQDPRPFAF